MKLIHSFPEKEKMFDFLLFFAIHYYVMLNDDKLWYVKKELKL